MKLSAGNCQNCIDARRASADHSPSCLGPQPPLQGILELDVTVQNHPDTHTCTIHNNDFRILTRAMESTGNDSAKNALLAGSCRFVTKTLFKWKHDSEMFYKQGCKILTLEHFAAYCNQAMMLLLQFAREARISEAVGHLQMQVDALEKRNQMKQVHCR